MTAEQLKTITRLLGEYEVLEICHRTSINPRPAVTLICADDIEIDVKHTGAAAHYTLSQVDEGKYELFLTTDPDGNILRDMRRGEIIVAYPAREQ